jgi:hypothetical protein
MSFGGVYHGNYPPGTRLRNRPAEFKFRCTNDDCPELKDCDYLRPGDPGFDPKLHDPSIPIKDEDRLTWTAEGYVEGDTNAGVLGDEENDPLCPRCGEEGENV